MGLVLNELLSGLMGTSTLSTTMELSTTSSETLSSELPRRYVTGIES